MLKIVGFLSVFLVGCASAKASYVHKTAFSMSTVVILDRDGKPIGAHKKLETKEWVEEQRKATQREIDSFRRSY